MAGLIDYSIIKPELTNALAAGFEQSQNRQQLRAQQEQQNALADIQLRAAKRGEEDVMAQREAYKSQDPIKALYAGGYGQQAMALQKQQQEDRATRVKQVEEELKIGRSIAERAYAAGRAASMSAPGTEKAAVISALKQFSNQGIDLSQDLNEIAGLPDAQVLEHVFAKSQELKTLSEMVATDTGGAVVRTPRFQQPGVANAAAIPATAPAQFGMPAGIPGQTPTTRAAGTNALALPAPGGIGGAMPAGQPQAIPGGGMIYPKSMTPQQQVAEARAQRSLELQEQAASPEFQQRMAEARALGQQTAKNTTTAVQSLPKIIDQAKQASNLIDEMIGQRDTQGNLVKGAKPHPGFESAVGAGFPGLKFVPGTETAGFVSRFDQIKGQSFLSAFESLKGGGSITNIEGDKATAAINRMNLSTNEREFVQAAKELKQIIIKGVERAQAKVDKARSQNPSLEATSIAPTTLTAGGAGRRQIAPGVFVTERP